MTSKEIKEMRRSNRSYLIYLLVDRRIVKLLTKKQIKFGEAMDMQEKNLNEYTKKLEGAMECKFCTCCDRNIELCTCK